MKTTNRLLAWIYRHGLWRAACVVLAILYITSPALAAQPLTGTFKGKVIGQFVNFTNLKNKIVTDWAGVLSLQLDQNAPGDGLGPLVPVFCIEVNVLVRGGDRYKSDGPVTALRGGCQIRYLLDRYPAATATTAPEAAARQLAIWHFSDDIDLTTVQESAIRARAITLADEAELAVALGGCPGAQASVTSLTLNPPTASVIAGQVVNYTVTADPPGAAQNVDISISGSATLQNGQQQATLPLIQGVATFSVVNPVVGSSTITARLPYALDAGTVFSPINAARATQRLVMADRVSLSASATVQAAWGAATDTPTAGLPTAAPPTATPLPTDIPPTDIPPTATSSTAASPTATPFGGASSTATPFGGAPSTATPLTTATPTVAAPTQATPVNAPPGEATATPTHKPSSGPKPSPQPPSTPSSTPSGGSSSPPAGGAGPSESGTPTSSEGSPANDLPGSNGGAGGAGSGSGTGGGMQIGSADTSGRSGAIGSDVPRPSQLPNTGAASSSTTVVIVIAALLLGCGIWMRRMRGKRFD
jgi:LPXTG-motif cell wall-anchored protein